MKENAKILITGSLGMIGSAVVRRLQIENKKLLTPSKSELDCRNQQAVYDYFAKQKPDYVFHLGAIVGGIDANRNFPAKFIFENTQMHCNIIHAAYENGVKKLLFPGSACTYPKLAPQPILESSFLDGKIEPTNIAYAASKINGIIMCGSYAREGKLNAIVPMPTNAYGIGDNFDANTSHVIPALMKRIHEAKQCRTSEVTLWGSGRPMREFIYVDDLAEAFVFLMHHYEGPDIINVGTMEEITIEALAKKIARIVGFNGNIVLDPSRPDGAPRKCLNSETLFNMGFRPKISLDEGLEKMYAYYQKYVL
jgi:GDP-L-fucose synthase